MTRKVASRRGVAWTFSASGNSGSYLGCNSCASCAAKTRPGVFIPEATSARSRVEDALRDPKVGRVAAIELHPIDFMEGQFRHGPPVARTD
jgi:hypothetical protein